MCFGALIAMPIAVQAQITDLANRYSDTLSFKDLFPYMRPQSQYHQWVGAPINYGILSTAKLDGEFDRIMKERSKKFANFQETFFGVYGGRYFVLTAQVKGRKSDKDCQQALMESTTKYANEVVKELVGKEVSPIHDDRVEHRITPENCEHVYPKTSDGVFERNMVGKETFLLKILQLGKNDRSNTFVLVRFFDIPGCPYRECEDFEEWASDASSCEASCYGCTDPMACNFDQTASVDDESCEFDCYGCMDDSADNYCTSCTKSDGSCIYSGCTDPLHRNYNVSATIDDGSCNNYEVDQSLDRRGRKVFWSCGDSYNLNYCEAGNNVYAVNDAGFLFGFGTYRPGLEFPAIVTESEIASIEGPSIAVTADSLILTWGDVYPNGTVDPMGVGKVIQVSHRNRYDPLLALDSETRLHAWRQPLMNRNTGELIREKYKALVVLLREKGVLREAKGIQQFNFSQGVGYAADDKGRLYESIADSWSESDTLIFDLKTTNFASFAGDYYYDLSGRLISFETENGAAKYARGIAGRDINEAYFYDNAGFGKSATWRAALVWLNSGKVLVYADFPGSRTKTLEKWLNSEVAHVHSGENHFAVIQESGTVGLGSTMRHFADYPKTGNHLLAMTEYLQPHDYSEYTYHGRSIFSTVSGGGDYTNKYALCPDKDIREQDVYTIDEMVEYFICDCLNEGIGIRPQTIQATFESLTDPTIALAFGRDMDNDVIVKVDPTNWNRASLPKKWYILYHELGHDIFNLEHGQGGKMMFNFANKEYSWAEFLADRAKMFSYVMRNQ